MTSCALVWMSGPDEGRGYPISGNSVMVGRSIDAVMRLAREGVSRFHARLSWAADGRVAVRDLDSASGTYVNDQRVCGDRILEPDDVLRFGPQAAFTVCYGFKQTAHDTDEVDLSSMGDSVTALLAIRNQARMHLAAFEYEQAADLFERVLLGLQQAGAPAVEDLGEISTDLGRCRLEQGRISEAISLFERAVAALEQGETIGRSLSVARFALARSLYSRDPHRAVGLAGAAADILPSDDPARAEIEQWFASRASGG